MNNLELRDFGSRLGNNGSNSLDSRRSDAGRAPAVQIQEDVMQVALVYDAVVPALAGRAVAIFPQMMPLSYI